MPIHQSSEIAERYVIAELMIIDDHVPTHHKISRQYLPLYLGEISYRFNHRHEPDLFRTILANALETDREVVAKGAAA